MQPSQKSTFRIIITAIGIVVLTPILTIPMLVSALLVKPGKFSYFMMAVQTGIPILPVVCNGAFKVLPKKTLAFRPGHIKLNICPPIPTQGLSEKDVPELMSRTRQAILAKLRLDYDPFLTGEPCT